jgi:hypothetical protein
MSVMAAQMRVTGGMIARERPVPPAPNPREDFVTRIDPHPPAPGDCLMAPGRRAE